MGLSVRPDSVTKLQKCYPIKQIDQTGCKRSNSTKDQKDGGKHED